MITRLRFEDVPIKQASAVYKNLGVRFVQFRSYLGC